MKLTDLEAEFIRYERDGQHTYLPQVDDLADAQGVIFLCPQCWRQNKGPLGTHSVICWSSSRGVPDFATPKPGRWRMDGTGLHDLTLNSENPGGGARSVQLLGGCGWHGFITNGEVT